MVALLLIFTITRENYAEVLPKFNHSDLTLTDVRNAVNAGKVVTIHASEIVFNGWKGAGYIILDKVSGSWGLYDWGGLDGAYLVALGFALIALSIFVFIGLLAGTVATGGVTLGAALLATPELLAGLSIGIAMIARGFEMMTGSYLACQIYRYSLGLALGALTAKYSWIVGLIVTNAYGGAQEFIGSDTMCLPDIQP